MTVMFYLLGTVLTTIGVMVAMDEFSKMKIAEKHRELMRVMDTFRRA